MEYININAINKEAITPPEVRDSLYALHNDITPADHVMTTDYLELIRGENLIEEARARGETLLPLKRVYPVRTSVRFPKRVILELTSQCNTFCTMCPRNALTRKFEHMATALAKRVITELAEVGISGLWLFNIGESLMHPDFFEILDHCRKYDTLGTLWLSTNGNIMTEAMREKVLAHPVDILNYSVNAMTEESYKRVVPNFKFDCIQRNFRALISRKKEMGLNKPVIRAQMIEIPYLLHEIDQFKEEFGDKADIIAINQLELFSQNVKNNNSQGEVIKNTHIPKCNRLEREDFFIMADGAVSCCDTDFNCILDIGNVKEMTVQQIYEGEKYQGIIRQYREGRLHEQELCSLCRDYNL